jgi:hypothetical protein
VDFEGIWHVVEWVVLLGAAGFIAWRWWSAEDPVAAFAAFHAPAGSRLTDAVSWFVWHAARCRAGSGALDRARIGKAAACLAIALAVAAVPLAGIALGDTNVIASHGAAFGVAALLWAVLVEFTMQPKRDAEYAAAAGRASRLLRLGVAHRVAVVTVADLLIVLLFHLNWLGQGSVRAGLLGIALVAFADLAAVGITLVVGAHEGTPFTD